MDFIYAIHWEHIMTYSISIDVSTSKEDYHFWTAIMTCKIGTDTTGMFERDYKKADWDKAEVALNFLNFLEGEITWY